MSTGKLLLLLSTILIVVIILCAVLFLILMVLATAHQRSGVRITHLRRRVADLLVTYCNEYYVPFSASIAKASLALSEYRSAPSLENRFKAFYFYCRYIYQENRLFTAGVPFPFEKKQCAKFIDKVQATLSVTGLSNIQHQECITALTNAAACETSENYEYIRDALQGKLPHEDSFGAFLEKGANDFGKLQDMLTELYGELSQQLDHIFSLSGIQTPTESIKQILKDMWTELRQLRTLDKVSAEPEIKIEISKWRMVVTLTALLLGLCYITVFIPSTYVSAKTFGLNPFNVLLFADMGPGLRQAFDANLFPSFSSADALPTLLALGACIGMLLFSASIAVIADPVRIGLTVKGLINALAITTLLGYLIGTLPFDSVTFRLFIFKFGYLLACFMLLSSLPALLGKHGLYRIKYEKLFNGLYGIIAG